MTDPAKTEAELPELDEKECKFENCTADNRPPPFGFDFSTGKPIQTFLQADIDAAVLAERERCARVCEEYADELRKDPGNDDNLITSAENCAAAIRAQKEPT
jgi:hypothetical protein